MSEALDDDYLLAYATEQQRRNPAPWRPTADEMCRYCGPGHVWHGMACAGHGPAFPCDCPSSFREAS